MDARNYMKSLPLMAILMALLVFPNLVAAAEFSADMIQTRGGTTLKGKLYVKNKTIRMETNEAGRSAITILNAEKGSVLILQPEQKIYMEMPGATDKVASMDADAEIEKLADKKHLGTEDVNGYECDKYLYTYHDKSMGTMIQWVARKLEYPIKMEYRNPQSEMLTEYTNIKEGEIDDSLFQVPSGYRKFGMP